MKGQVLPGCVTPGSSFTSLCLIDAGLWYSQRGAQVEARRWDLECQVQGLGLFFRLWGATEGLWAPQRLGSGTWP